MKKFTPPIVTVVAAVLALSITAQTRADFVSPNGIVATSIGLESGTAFGSTTAIINGAGLATTVPALTDGNIGSTNHARGFNASNQWILADGDVTGGLFTFFTSPGGLDLTDLYVWNYSQDGVDLDLRGIGDYNVYLDTGSGFGGVHTSGTLASAGPTGSHFAQQISLGGTQTGVVAVQIEATALAHSAGGSGSVNGIGLDEVVFRHVVGTPPPPPPPPAGKTVTDITPTWEASNHQRVFIGGGGDEFWINYDEGTSGAVASQQWQWMDISSTLGSIPAGEMVVSATLSFTDATVNGFAPDNFSVFAVPGDGSIGDLLSDLGRQEIIDFNGLLRDGSEVPDYYAGNTAYGLVTVADINAAGAVEFDITDLIAGWYDGSLTQNVGQLMILGNNNNHFVTWAGTASISVTTMEIANVIPTPAALPAGLAMIGLAAMRWRRR